MPITSYANLKTHFDKLIRGGYPKSNGLEPIRDTYGKAFNFPIHLQEILTTKLAVKTNSIVNITTLIGPDPKPKDDDDIPRDIPIGLILAEDGSVCHVNHFEDEVLNITEEDNDFKYYITDVYDIMLEVVKYDQLYNQNSKIKNPYCDLLYLLPLYLTYWHIRDCFGVTWSPEYSNIIEKYYFDSEFIPLVEKSLKDQRQFSADTNVIYNVMTVGNTIDIN